jgi:VWFA-related protein
MHPMRALVFVAVGALLLTAVPGAAQNAGAVAYRVEIDRDEASKPKVVHSFREVDGRQGLYVTLQFKVLRSSDGAIATDVTKDEIEVREDGRRVEVVEISQPRSTKLTTVLAIDISGSMTSHGKMDEAKRAANVFLDKLDPHTDGGLILFDHEMKVEMAPVRDPARYAEHRAALRAEINKAQPRGGTAYLDAAARAVRMLAGIEGRKAVLVMTDGVDMNSKLTLEQVIAEAQKAQVPIYTLGVGEPGSNEPVSTVLVLDHSGSMRAPANDTDKVSKIEALHNAASRFVELMRPSAQTTLLPFSSSVSKPEPFSANKAVLKRRIGELQPLGGTLLYDATLAGIETLVASQRPGKKAVVVLTDGKDESPGSRNSDRVVVERAKEVGIPLHMLGLGRKHEINGKLMTEMAEATGGSYQHAENQQALFEIFEKLSIDLHDDGIDEKSLTTLAEQTGGKYRKARDAKDLHFLYEQLAEELQSTYTLTYLSPRSKHDGTARPIDVSVVRGGVRVSDVGSADYNVEGVVVPEMDYRVYLILLLLLGGLLTVPGWLRGLTRTAG